MTTIPIDATFDPEPPTAQTTFRHATGGDADKYRAVIQAAVQRGARDAGSVIERIHTQQPRDQIVRSVSIVVRPAEQGVRVAFGDDAYSTTDYALGQVAERVGAPGKYVRDEAAATEPWRREAIAALLTSHYANGGSAGERALARSVNGQLRGLLSDKYRRLDSRPLIDALVQESDAAGAVPIGGSATETRFALKVIHPDIIELSPGEFVALGGEWSNSDYGNGKHGFRSFVLRVACLNGATREDALSQIHLGAKLSDNIEFSERTYRLDTATSVSALRDTVRGLLAPAGRDRVVAELRAAQEKAISRATLAGRVKDLPKSTQKSVLDAYDGEDVINLPAGQTAWRASNAISWVAKHAENAETKLDLERLAGALLPGGKEATAA